MDKIEIIDEKVKACVKLIKNLSEQNAKISKSYNQLSQERDLLQQENQQVRKILAELDKLKTERKFIRQKLERLSAHYRKLKLYP